MQALPLPRLERRTLQGIPLLTDDALADALGVRIAFSGRGGGSSASPFDSLNLGSHVGDESARVASNRAALMHALGAEGMPLIVPKQVHGIKTVQVDAADKASVARAAEQAECGADAVAVSACDVAALLCFADCAPVIVVGPLGSFAIAHAGWRGAVAGIAGRALRAVARSDARRNAHAGASEREIAAQTNIYIGPCIHGECFEVGDEVRQQFAEAYGSGCLRGDRFVDIPAAVSIDLVRAGASSDRVCDAGICTVCDKQTYFSYRASGGVCGRHGAVAFRRKDGSQ